MMTWWSLGKPRLWFLKHIKSLLKLQLVIWLCHFLCDLHDENGCPVLSQWFRLNGQKSSDQVYVGSTSAVVACSFVLRNPSESEFLRSEAFLSLKRTINVHVLKESDIDHRPAQDLCCVSTDRDSKSDEGEIPQELKEEKLSLESSFPGSPPKCSTPRRQSPTRQNLKSPLAMLTVRLLQVPVTTPRNLLDLYRQFLRY